MIGVCVCTLVRDIKTQSCVCVCRTCYKLVHSIWLPHLLGEKKLKLSMNPTMCSLLADCSCGMGFGQR